jgi:hypothetical protein
LIFEGVVITFPSIIIELMKFFQLEKESNR